MNKPRSPKYGAKPVPTSDVADTLVDKRAPKAAPKSFVAEVVSALAPIRPDLVDRLVGFERQIREAAVDHARKRTQLEHKRLEDLVNRLQQLLTSQKSASDLQLEAIRQAGQAQLEAVARALDEQNAATASHLQGLVQVARTQLDKVQTAEEKHAVTLTRHLELVRQAEERRRQGVEKHVALYGEQGEKVQQLLAEQQAAQQKLQTAHAALTKDHAALRQSLDKATKEHARTVAEMTRSFAEQTSAGAEKQAHQKKQIHAWRDKLEQTEDDLEAALAARDRLLQHVERVEVALESTLVPLRKKADASQQRCAELEAELADTKRAQSLGVPKLPTR